MYDLRILCEYIELHRPGSTGLPRWEATYDTTQTTYRRVLYVYLTVKFLCTALSGHPFFPFFPTLSGRKWDGTGSTLRYVAC